MIALSDELRPDAADVLKVLAAQGIDFKIISGDNPETKCANVTPLAIAAGVPCLTERAVVTGAELESATDRHALIEAHAVFGRVSPVQKVQIIATLKEQGRRVAMIGDGVNDVLPIKHAHLGIAMGEGSQASKRVSSIVLETNHFALLPEILDEGRIIVRNVRLAAKLFLTKNLFAMLLIVGTLGHSGLAFPFLPRHVTLLNTLTIGIPALLIMVNRKRVQAPTRRTFLEEVGAFVLLRGVSVGLVGMGVLMMSAHWLGDDHATQRTLLLGTLILSGWITLWLVLREEETAPWLRLLPFVLLPAFLALMYWPLTSTFFDLTPLTFWQWSLALAWALLGFAFTLLLELTLKLAASRERKRPE